MSTRALYSFLGDGGQYHVYKHHDGYPTGALGFIKKACAHAWELPRFEADEFAAAFIAANKDSSGGVRLTTGKTWKKAAPSDIEYHYNITCVSGEIHVAIFAADCWDKPTERLLFAGPLAECIKWAEESKKARA